MTAGTARFGGASLRRRARFSKIARTKGRAGAPAPDCDREIMEEKRNSLTEQEFHGLCRHVCSRLIPSHYRDLDRETLYFAIYWRMCDLLGEKLVYPSPTHPRIATYRREIQQLLRLAQAGAPFDAAAVADWHVEKVIARHYGAENEKDLAPQRSRSGKKALIFTPQPHDVGGRYQFRLAPNCCGRFESIRFDTPESLN